MKPTSPVFRKPGVSLPRATRPGSADRYRLSAGWTDRRVRSIDPARAVNRPGFDGGSISWEDGALCRSRFIRRSEGVPRLLSARRRRQSSTPSPSRRVSKKPGRFRKLCSSLDLVESSTANSGHLSPRTKASHESLGIHSEVVIAHVLPPALLLGTAKRPARRPHPVGRRGSDGRTPPASGTR
jgi:hypothetical protein